MDYSYMLNLNIDDLKVYIEEKNKKNTNKKERRNC